MKKETLEILTNKEVIALNQDLLFYQARVGLDASKEYTMRDLWTMKNYPSSVKDQQTFHVPAHGVVVLRIKGTSDPYDPYQYK